MLCFIVKPTQNMKEVEKEGTGRRRLFSSCTWVASSSLAILWVEAFSSYFCLITANNSTVILLKYSLLSCKKINTFGGFLEKHANIYFVLSCKEKHRAVKAFIFTGNRISKLVEKLLLSWEHGLLTKHRIRLKEKIIACAPTMAVTMWDYAAKKHVILQYARQSSNCFNIRRRTPREFH